MRIALASLRVATTVEDGLERVRRSQALAAERGARIVCFPEAYLPGLRGQDFPVPAFDGAAELRALEAAALSARACGIATILGMEHHGERGREIVAWVISAAGVVLGRQAKIQIDPSEDTHYVPGQGRRVFELEGLRFGIAICHEGWRYPETVRWAAQRGARIVFHPQHTGSDRSGPSLVRFGSSEAPYYEKAILCRSIENTIYFASVNYALRYQESATCVIAPPGECVAQLPYGEEGVLVHELDLARASGLLASRYAPERYFDGARV